MVVFRKKYKCNQISATEYPVPHGGIDKHCDKLNGWVLLFSLGCKPKLFVQNGKLNDSVEKMIDFRSASVLIFDSSTKAKICHGIKGIEANTCPKPLEDRSKSLKSTMVEHLILPFFTFFLQLLKKCCQLQPHCEELKN